MNNPTCTVEGCAKRVRVISRGLCAAHYAKWQKYGDPTAGTSYKDRPEFCTHPGCERAYSAGGYCNAHYLRSRNGRAMDAPMRVTVRDAEESFLLRTRQQGECLLWTGGTNAYGYGIQYAGRARAQGPLLAHRYAWERENGPVPEGMDLDHVCWNRACVNVDHLRVVTRAQNSSNRQGGSPTSATGVRNVYRKRDKYRVQIVKGQVAYNFGVYSTVQEAAAVAERERARLFGDFAGGS